MDEVPASSWYTPRIGYQELSGEELLKGPEVIGAPVPPFTVVKAKKGGNNPGFIVKDSRGYTYLAKFDPKEFPALETTTAVIVNRLFWGFGYNVPEDYLVLFKERDLQFDPDGELKPADIKEVLSNVAPPLNENYRSTFSMFIKGNILGPIAEKGVREDDINDTFNHENRRVLRAMKIFCAFTNHSDIRIDNMLDVYHGESGKGFVKHYLLDFGEAFGGHGAEHDWLWDGYDYYFSFKDLMVNYATLGLKVRPWEKLEYRKWMSVGAFESELFSPATWNETYQFYPIQISQPDDDYWAAKILSELTDDHIKTLVNEAKYPDIDAADYVYETLLKRRDKVIRYFYSQVSPVEFVKISGSKVVLEDLGQPLFPDSKNETEYFIKYFDGSDKMIRKETVVPDGTSLLNITIPDKNEYLWFTVSVKRGKIAKQRAAQFHLRKNSNREYTLVGIIH
jgi:hypothetical protein